jgi:hypothetical protein
VRRYAATDQGFPVRPGRGSSHIDGCAANTCSTGPREWIARGCHRHDRGALAPGVVGDYFPNATYEQLAAKDDVCSGAKPQLHYHFFTADGFFGSLDQKERQVDDGTYTIVDSKTLRIGDDAVFDFRIQGATLQLTPRITDEQRQYALSHPTEFTAAAYMVAVAVQGIKWKHVPCQGWC